MGEFSTDTLKTAVCRGSEIRQTGLFLHELLQSSMARDSARSVFASFHLLLYFFSARNAKHPTGSAAGASVCAQRGRTGKRQRRGGGGDLTTTKTAHFWTRAFLLFQDSSCTNLRPFASVTERMKWGISEEITDTGGDTGGMGREDILHWSQSPHAGRRAEILVHRQPLVLLWHSKEDAKLIAGELRGAGELPCSTAAPCTQNHAANLDFRVWPDGGAARVLWVPTKPPGALTCSGVSLTPVLLHLPSMQLTSLGDPGVKPGI